MNYAHVENGAVSAYPFSKSQFRKKLAQGDPAIMLDPNADEAEFASFGLLPVVEEPPEHNPARQYVTQRATGFWTVGPTSVTATHTIHNRTLAERRPALKDKVKAFGATLLNAGYHHDFGSAIGEQVLQLRDGTDDARNWLASQGAYTAAVMLGQGAVEEAKIRTEANETITMSYQDGLAVLLTMQAWASSLFQTSWAKQD